MFSLSKFLRSFKYAGRGIVGVFRSEQNFKFHLLATVVVVALGIYFKIKTWEWLALIFSIVLVLILEMLNTVFERLVDMFKPRLHLYAGQIKNIMSGAVLIAAVSAIIIGFLVFWPYFSVLFSDFNFNLN